jgi:hypothetical protein
VKRDPTPEQVALITKYVRQKNELDRRPPDSITDLRKAYDLSAFLAYAKQDGFCRMKKDIEETAEHYARAAAPLVRYIGYPPSASDPAPVYQSWGDYLDHVTWTKLRRFCIEKARGPNRPKYHREGPGKGVAQPSKAKHRRHATINASG